jgi:hypothetical protein
VDEYAETVHHKRLQKERVMEARLSTSIQPDWKRLEQMRLATGMNLYDVAAKLRTTPQAVAAAESGGWVGRDLVVAMERLYTTGEASTLS